MASLSKLLLDDTVVCVISYCLSTRRGSPLSKCGLFFLTVYSLSSWFFVSGPADDHLALTCINTLQSYKVCEGEEGRGYCLLRQSQWGGGGGEDEEEGKREDGETER